MSQITPEVLADVAKGLCWDELCADSESILHGRFCRIVELEGGGSDSLSTADLAASCKAKLRELGKFYRCEGGDSRGYAWVNGFAVRDCDTDDLALILAFAQAVRAGAVK